jgi:hypothetical protein
MRIAFLLPGAVAAALLTTAAVAQVVPLNIPADAPRGRFTAGEFPAVAINGKPMRLAPGARILTPNNLTVTPNQVAPETPVRYRLDAQGQVHTVWIMNAEAARKR